MKYYAFLVVFCFFCLNYTGDARTLKIKKYLPPSIIPQPAKIEFHKGHFEINKRTIIVADANSQTNNEFFRSIRFLREKTRLPLRIAKNNKTGKSNFIRLQFVNDQSLGEEGYRVAVHLDSVIIQSHHSKGLFYAVQSLSQLASQATSITINKRILKWFIPSVSIVDTPRFKWRGMHLDVSRHFFPRKFIYTYLDMLAMHKFNVFHWHLTDDQGWRIEIKKYPKLTEIGAWRVDREHQNWDFRDPPKDNEQATYGGYYTQNEIKKIVKYAAERNITIVPEIEMPAHTTAALAAYPQYSCTGGPFKVPPGGVWPVTDIYCAGNDSTFYFLQDVLTEVMDLFPGTYIHIGGDEADKKEWRACPKCQKRMKDEGLKDESELQSYLVKRIEKFIVSKGRRMIGWDEILEGGLAPDATVMSWRGVEGGITAARQNHDVVMTPGSHCYFDYYQGPRESEPLAIGGFTPLSKVYSFEPVPESLTTEQAKHVLGAQANVWTEYIPTLKHAQYMTLPRMAAMAEVLWSPKESRNWNDFSQRLEKQFERYEAAGYNYATTAYLVSIAPTIDTLTKRVSVSLSKEMANGEIRYTLDGTKPTARSPIYKEPFIVNQTSVIQAGTFVDAELLSKFTERKILFHKAMFKNVTITYPYERYGDDQTLTNGLRGGIAFNDGNWQGYHQNDFEAVIDLGDVTSISSISVNFLQNTKSWIFHPQSVEISVSTDSVNFQTVRRTEIPVAKKNEEPSMKEVQQEFPSINVRYVRVNAKNVGLCPDWHIGRGDKAWLFVDEIIVE
ncbi:MAG: family 20 glycosylhydrolase [Ignavibacteriae bacterium]|nr:family 20 glycosylhydrolase [Ignavibacteriota bacterium]